ncbi:WD repeat-containing protein 74 [Halyomorpha halys]|uniref:WD repeat-containing protein 74 n=1 Tax=Halyomorpha halys TaxID=286706 RepID=UPI0006D4DF36|nr:WD repeat-containing protein 74 [Halyomorpha halys]
MKSVYFNAFVGTASGVFKGVTAVEKCDLYVKNLDSLKTATNKNPITAMNWGDGFEEEVVIGYGSQLVKIYNLKTRSFTMAEEKKCGEGAIIGISRRNCVLLTAVESGLVKLWREGSDPLTINTGGPLERVRPSPHHSNIIATGGKENDLKLWDTQTGEQTFSAKNVRHDDLELRVPVWITDMAFILNTRKVAVTTRHGYVRLYDPSTCTRRPVVSVQVPEQALTCISCSSKEHHVIVGSGSGQMNLVDLRSRGLVMNKYKGFVGGIKAIACSEEEPYIASVSLDRHFRVHHLYTKELLLKEYMQSKLTCLLVRSNFDLTEPEREESGESSEERDKTKEEEKEKEESSSSDEAEEIFKNMPTVGEKRPKGTNLGKKKHKS